MGIVAALGVCAVIAAVTAVVLYRRGRAKRSGNEHASDPIFGRKANKKVCVCAEAVGFMGASMSNKKTCHRLECH